MPNMYYLPEQVWWKPPSIQELILVGLGVQELRWFGKTEP